MPDGPLTPSDGGEIGPTDGDQSSSHHEVLNSSRPDEVNPHTDNEKQPEQASYDKNAKRLILQLEIHKNTPELVELVMAYEEKTIEQEACKDKLQKAMEGILKDPEFKKKVARCSSLWNWTNRYFLNLIPSTLNTVSTGSIYVLQLIGTILSFVTAVKKGSWALNLVALILAILIGAHFFWIWYLMGYKWGDAFKATFQNGIAQFICLGLFPVVIAIFSLVQAYNSAHSDSNQTKPGKVPQSTSPPSSSTEKPSEAASTGFLLSDAPASPTEGSSITEGPSAVQESSSTEGPCPTEVPSPVEAPSPEATSSVVGSSEAASTDSPSGDASASLTEVPSPVEAPSPEAPSSVVGSSEAASTDSPSGDASASLTEVPSPVEAPSPEAPSSVVGSSEAASTDSPSGDASASLTEVPSPVEAPSPEAPSSVVGSSEAASTDSLSGDASASLTEVPSPVEAPSPEAPSSVVGSSEAGSTDSPSGDASASSAEQVASTGEPPKPGGVFSSGSIHCPSTRAGGAFTPAGPRPQPSQYQSPAPARAHKHSVSTSPEKYPFDSTPDSQASNSQEEDCEPEKCRRCLVIHAPGVECSREEAWNGGTLMLTDEAIEVLMNSVGVIGSNGEIYDEADGICLPKVAAGSFAQTTSTSHPSVCTTSLHPPVFTTSFHSSVFTTSLHPPVFTKSLITDGQTIGDSPQADGLAWSAVAASTLYDTNGIMSKLHSSTWLSLVVITIVVMVVVARVVRSSCNWDMKDYIVSRPRSWYLSLGRKKDFLLSWLSDFLLEHWYKKKPIPRYSEV